MGCLMGLYINDENDLHIFKNDAEKIREPQQKLMMNQWITEWMEEQRQMNQTLSNNHYLLNNQVRRQGEVQTYLLERLEQFEKLQQEYVDSQNQLSERIIVLNNEYEQLESRLKNNEASNEQIMNELKVINEATHSIMDSLKKQEALNDKLFDQFNELLTEQKDIKEKVDAQGTDQQEIMEKIDEQVATTEKIKQQIGHLRSVLYERSHYLSEKIEEHYEFTSQYVHQLLTGEKDSF